MIDIKDKGRMPTEAEIRAYTGCPLFDELSDFLRSEYQALCKIEYSGDKALSGWNVKFKKAGKTLCTLYPRKGSFAMLLVVGRKEKPRVEALLPTLCEAFQKTYRDTREGMGQRWLLLHFSARDSVYDDALKIIRIRRECG